MKANSLFSKCTKGSKFFVSAIIFSAVSFNSVASNNPKKNVPNQLVSFTADCHNYYAQIKWTTSEERIQSSYVIERTKDGIHFEKIYTGKNSVENQATTVAHEYSIIDETPYSGISYYRISEMDAENKTINVNTIVYSPCENEESINSIVDDSNITVSVNSACSVVNVCNVTILDQNNMIIYDNTYKVVNGLNSFKFDPKLTEGKYTIVVEHKHHKSFKKEFVVGNPSK